MNRLAPPRRNLRASELSPGHERTASTTAVAYLRLPAARRRKGAAGFLGELVWRMVASDMRNIILAALAVSILASCNVGGTTANAAPNQFADASGAGSSPTSTGLLQCRTLVQQQSNTGSQQVVVLATCDPSEVLTGGACSNKTDTVEVVGYFSSAFQDNQTFRCAFTAAQPGVAATLVAQARCCHI